MFFGEGVNCLYAVFIEEWVVQSLRRNFLKSAGAAGTVGAALAAGLLKPGQVLAAEWHKETFGTKGLLEVLKAVGGTAAISSKDIDIEVPDIAENGAAVPVKVTSKIAGAESITLLVEKNNFPLVATFARSGGTEGYIMTRIKMAQTSSVKVLVKAGGKVYTASKEVKVTIGGCGG